MFHHTSRSNSAAGATKAVSVFSFLLSMFEGPKDEKELMDIIIDRCAIPLSFLNVGYLVIRKYTLSTFSCITFMDLDVIQFSPDDLCYSQKQWNLMMIGTGMLRTF